MTNKHYRVIVRGKNLLACESFGKKSKFGFYVDVFVDAENALDAGYAAVKSVQQDKELCGISLNRENDGLVLHAEEIVRSSRDRHSAPPRSSFTFYLD